MVVLHDDKVDRTSNGSGLASSLLVCGHIRDLDFGLGERIPTLEEAIDCIPSEVLVNVELKGENTAIPSLEVLRTFCDREFLISSFRISELERIASEAIDAGEICGIGLLHLGLDGDRLLKCCQKSASNAIGLCDPFVQEGTIAFC